MNNQLRNISTQYRKFSKGQYIEETQFNEFLDFFEDQDRLSEVMLQGVGIVCGFKPNPIYIRNQLNSIQLSQGIAVTTDGDLLTLNATSEVVKDLYMSDLKTIEMEGKDYTHFKGYDNFKVKYPAFYEGKDNQIELWELATTQEAASDFQPIHNLTSLDDKYLLLYLENYEKEVKPCTGVDCDNHGIQQIRNLKVLLTTAKGINHIIKQDGIQPHPLFAEGVMVPVKQERAIMEQLLLKKGSDERLLSSDLKEFYMSILEKNDYGRVVFENINAIIQILGLPGIYYQGFKNTLDKFLDQKMGFQYAYDVVKDLTDTYSEIVTLLPKAFTKDFPDLLAFPKHIMLGKLISDKQLDFSRHQFYNSPVLDNEKETQRVELLIERFKQQVQNFWYFNVFDNGNAQVKITPSQKLKPLSNKAIPFYYVATEELLRAWNFEKTSHRSFGDNLRYGGISLPLGSNINPLQFNIDKNSFYNVEGHQGMHFQKALDLINGIRNTQQLGFDIMALSLEELVDNKDMSKAYFNEYVEQHSGLEHKRGVERGGTFIVVYESLENPRVIADFSLPYISCTPKIEVKLGLPGTTMCVNSDSVPFAVFPMNGDVKAVVEKGLNGGVEQIKGKYFFNPGAVSNELLGKEITFTVNGKPTNCIVKVTPQPNVTIKVTSVVYPEGGSTATIVNFHIEGDHFEDYIYTWDFWGEGKYISLKPDPKGNASYKFDDLDPKRISTIKVRVDNGGCIQNLVLNLDLLTDCPVVSRLTYKVADNDNGTQTFTFDWNLPSNLAGITEMNIYYSNDPATGWHVESGAFTPQRTLKLPFNKYYFRFELVGSCIKEKDTLSLPGFDNIGMGEEVNIPPTVTLRWSDNKKQEERECTQAVCSYKMEVQVDPADKVKTIQILKSTDNGVTWLSFINELLTDVFQDSIDTVGKQLYQAVVTDTKNNKVVSNPLSYKKEKEISQMFRLGVPSKCSQSGWENGHTGGTAVCEGHLDFRFSEMLGVANGFIRLKQNGDNGALGLERASVLPIVIDQNMNVTELFRESLYAYCSNVYECTPVVDIATYRFEFSVDGVNNWKPFTVYFFMTT